MKYTIEVGLLLYTWSLNLPHK